MRNYEPRTYSINDFLEWDANKQLELNPAFQRRRVWSERAKSFLMDTILRGKPIPVIFIRQRINVSTKATIRDVVDGQQRIRTILSFIRDGFTVSKAMNKEHGGRVFSELPDPIKSQVLEYALSVNLLVNLDDGEILDIFSRINSYSVVLNEQEKINAKFLGPFKQLADKIGHKYNEYWIRQGIWTATNIARMLEVNLVADLLIAMREGIKSKKRVRGFYDLYEETFPEGESAALSARFDQVVMNINDLYPEGLSDSEFSRPFLYYSLFTAFAHRLYGLKELKVPRHPFTGNAMQKARVGLDTVEELFAVPPDELGTLTKEEQQFLTDSRRATTDEIVRERRTKFLLKRMA